MNQTSRANNLALAVSSGTPTPLSQARAFAPSMTISTHFYQGPLATIRKPVGGCGLESVFVPVVR